MAADGLSARRAAFGLVVVLCLDVGKPEAQIFCFGSGKRAQQLAKPPIEIQVGRRRELAGERARPAAEVTLEEQLLRPPAEPRLLRLALARRMSLLGGQEIHEI